MANRRTSIFKLGRVEIVLPIVALIDHLGDSDLAARDAQLRKEGYAPSKTVRVRIRADETMSTSITYRRRNSDGTTNIEKHSILIGPKA